MHSIVSCALFQFSRTTRTAGLRPIASCWSIAESGVLEDRDNSIKRFLYLGEASNERKQTGPPLILLKDAGVIDR